MVPGAEVALLDGGATLSASGASVLKAGDTVTLSGTTADGSELGIISRGDISLNPLKSKTLAATSTEGSVDVYVPDGVQLISLSRDIEAQRADAGTAVVSSGSLSGIQAAGRADVTAGSLSGTQIKAGGDVGINTGNGSLSLNSISGSGVEVNSGATTIGTLEAGHSVHVKSSSLSGSQLRAGGEVQIDTGNLSLNSMSGSDVTVNSGSTTIGTLDAHSAQVNSGALTVNRVTVGGLLDINSANLRFDQITAGTADIDAGNIQMGALTTKKADIVAKGNISDNQSLVKTSELTMKAGGDIGSKASPIGLESTKINMVSGKNVYLREMSRGKDVLLGTITASGHLYLAAPLIGLPDGAYGFVDGNGSAVNLVAGKDLELDIAGKVGSPSKPMQAKVTGRWTLDSAGLHGMSNGDPSTGTPLSLIYMVFGDTDFTETPEYIGNGPIPGLVILNGRPVQGHPDLLRKIHSALAFSADTPELKSTQGVFGNPFFLSTDIALTDMISMGLFDYLKLSAGQRPDTGELGAVQYPNLRDQWGLPQTLLGHWDLLDVFPTRAVLPWLEQRSYLPLHVLRGKTQAERKASAVKEASANPAEPESGEQVDRKKAGGEKAGQKKSAPEKGGKAKAGKGKADSGKSGGTEKK